MEDRKEQTPICQECGEQVTAKDREDGNIRETDGKTCHKKCRLIRK